MRIGSMECWDCVGTKHSFLEGKLHGEWCRCRIEKVKSLIQSHGCITQATITISVLTIVAVVVVVVMEVVVLGTVKSED